MVNKVVLDYLSQYRDRYKIEDLKKEILSKGYSNGEIEEALLALGNKKEVLINKSVGIPLNDFKISKDLEALELEPTSRFSWLTLFGILGIILACGIIGIIILNYLGHDFLGINVFNL